MNVACSLSALHGRPLPEALADIARLGFGAVELSAAPGHACDPDKCDAAKADEIRALATGIGLSVCALSAPITWAGAGATTGDALEYTARCALTASRIGAPLLVTSTGPYPPQCDRFDAWDSVRDAILRATDHAESLGVALCVEPHVGHMCLTWESTVKLVREVGSANLRVSLDISQFLVLGLDHATALDRLSARIAHVHLQDFTLRRPPLADLREPRGNATAVALGDGDLPLADHLAHLRSADYSGALSVVPPPDCSAEVLARTAAGLSDVIC